MVKNLEITKLKNLLYLTKAEAMGIKTSYFSVYAINANSQTRKENDRSIFKSMSYNGFYEFSMQYPEHKKRQKNSLKWQ